MLNVGYYRVIAALHRVQCQIWLNKIKQRTKIWQKSKKERQKRPINYLKVITPLMSVLNLDLLFLKGF